MDLSPVGLRAQLRRPGVNKLLKYSAVSAISIVVSQIALFTALFWLSPAKANVVAVAVGTFPSYELNRKWAWGKTGKGHLWREIVPFWVLSFIGLAFSTLVVFLAGRWLGHTPESSREKLLINGASIAAFGVLWIGKFVIINKVLFAHQHHLTPIDELEPV